MSAEARKALVENPHLILRGDSQKADLLDPTRTQTQLIALLLEITSQGFYLVVTAVRADHHDDSDLGLHCHANGYALDCWPLLSPADGDYMDPASRHFQDFLEAVADSPWCYQVGLAGTAQTPENRKAAGHKAFVDDGADHIHLGAIGP